MSEEAVQRGSLWLDDGNLVLQAENVVFKVLKSILRIQSTVFADMLALPNCTQDDMYDGCPLVRMQDSADDLGLFLSAIFDHGHLDGIRGTAAVATLLGIAAKYDAKSLHHRAIVALQQYYPDTLEGMMAIRDRADALKSVRSYKPPPFDWELCAAVLREARKADAAVILPAAFLEATTQPLVEILSAPMLLEDRLAIILHRDKMVDLARKNPYCPQRVQASLYTCCSNRITELFTALHMFEAFQDPFESVSSSKQHLAMICSTCRDTITRCVKAEQKVAWENLPSLLGLPAWKTLRENAGI